MIVAVVDIFIVMNTKPIHELMLALKIGQVDETFRLRLDV